MRRNNLISCLSVLTIGIIWSCKDYILFWDTVQFAGKHPLFFIENGFNQGLLPQYLDSGHPPIFGLYLAGVWSLFGKTLAISHFAMLPFLWLNIIYATKLGEFCLKEKYWLFPVGMMVCPFYLGHSILVSPDIILITGFLITLYGLLSFKKSTVIIGSIVLTMISLRGFIMLSSLVLFHFVWLLKNGEKSRISFNKIISIYLPSILFFLLFQLWHYVNTDWVGYHNDSPWASSFSMVSLRGWVRNSLVFVWRLGDFGLCLPYLILVIKYKKTLLHEHALGQLVLILIGLLFLVIIPFDGLLNHRYFLPIQLVVLLLAFSIISQYKGYRSTIIGGLVIMFMFSGNFWVYPDKVSQGWDSTAGHWPFYKMEKDMWDHVKADKTLRAEMIGSDFPLLAPRKCIDLGTDTSRYAPFDIYNQEYIMWSNIMNGFSDEDLDILKTWSPIKTLENRNIRMILYKKNNSNSESVDKK